MRQRITFHAKASKPSLMLPFISDFKVVLVGLYKEQDCPFKMLSAPNNVVNHVMPIVWGHLTWHWQVIFFRVDLLQIIITFDSIL